MNKGLEERIVHDFPFMRRKNSYEEQKESGSIRDLYGAFGMEIGDGWYDLIYDLCKKIEDIYIKENREVDIVVDQIKEKFGGLRFYYHHFGEDKKIHAIDFLGVGSMRLHFDEEDDPIRKKVRKVVSEAEEKSKAICEKCGTEGKFRNELPRMLTLCDECYLREVKR